MKKTLRTLLCLSMAALLLFGCLPVSAHQNPFFPTADNENQGDPFILKYDGVYYLYSSNADHYVWSSLDLVNWEFCGNFLEEGAEYSIWAPEVFYRDGQFVLYTGPSGDGHIFFTSDSPTGPFVPATDNLGRKFDGSVLLDDDNQMYFVWPGTGIVSAAKMTDPLTVDDLSHYTIDVGVGNRHTEGPRMFKRDGKYYLFYTGNHVWEDSYRVEYAISDSPTTGWTEPADNTLLLDIEGDITGMGHNNFFIGPDLDTHYILYHSIKEFTDNPQSVIRILDYDAMVWNGEKLCVQGPTSWEIDDPAMPDFSERFDGDLSRWQVTGEWTVAGGSASASSGTLISNETTEDVFTAEFNITGKGEVLFSYTDDQNYGRVWLDSSAKQLKAELIVGGKSVWSGSDDLYSWCDYDALHVFKVQQTADTLHLYLDDVDRIQYEATGLTGGKIGYKATGNMKADFTAFSHKALGSGDCEQFIAVPGTIEAIHTQDTAATLSKVDAADGEMGFAVSMKSGEKATYNVNIKKQETYTIGLRAGSIAEGTKVNILVDGKKALEATLPAVGDDGYRTLPLHDLKLPSGKRTLTVEIVSGGMELYEIEIAEQKDVTSLSSDCTTQRGDDGAVFWKQFEAMPSWSGGTLNYTDYSTWGKLLAGEIGWTDYTVEADVSITAAVGSAGLMFRVLHGDNGIRPAASVNNDYYHTGYYLGINEGKIVLEKHNFGDCKTLKEISYAIEAMTSYHLKISVVGDTYTVWVDGTEVMSYTDQEYPILTGRTGIRSHKAMASFDNFKVAPVDPLVQTTAFEVTYGDPITDGGNEGGDSNNGGGQSGGTQPSEGLPIGLIIGIAAGVVVIAAVVVVVIVMGKKKKVPTKDPEKSDGEQPPVSE